MDFPQYFDATLIEQAHIQRTVSSPKKKDDHKNKELGGGGGDA
jgi:hypothetical protein